MEELIKFASFIIPAFLILALVAAVLILVANVLFIFAELCARLTQQVLKIITKRFAEKES